MSPAIEPTGGELVGGAYSRRQVLRTGGLVIGITAIAAACGDTAGPTDPGRLGVAPPVPTLPEVTVDDLVILRTAQSLSHTCVAVHQAALDSGTLDDSEAELLTRIIENDTRAAEAVGELVTAGGGESWTCANPFMMDRIVVPTLEVIDASSDKRRDYLNTSNSFESWAGMSYQAMLPIVVDGPTRTQLMTFGGEALRHASVLARMINPKEPFAPTFFGDPIAKDEEGFWPVYQIPSQFGRVSAIDLVVGDPSDEGARFATQLQTPAANSYVYPHQSC